MMEPGQIAPADLARGPMTAQPALRRKVFYVSGFDPLGPRRYRELYRSEAPKQAKTCGYSVEVEGKPAAEDGAYRWQARFRQGLLQSEADFEFLGWDDIVRHSIRPSLIHVYRVMFLTLVLYLRSGALRALLKLRRGPMVAGLYPVAVMLFYLLFAGLSGLAAGIGVGAAGLPWWGALLTGCAAFGLVMAGTRYTEEQVLAYFLVNDLSWSAQESGAYPAALNARLDEFAAKIATAVTAGDHDEVLVVGHSSGAQLAVTALRRALGQIEGRPETEIALLTLGQSIPMTSFLPGAEGLRDDLVALADDPRVFWLDITAPSDGACFALVDPVALTRSTGRPARAVNPVILSATFRHTMGKEAFRRIKRRLFRLHFQYLCAFAHPGAYDYFRITAGPKPLRAQFEHQPSSPSALIRPAGPLLHPG